MSATESLQPLQFDNEERLRQYHSRGGNVKGDKAPVFYASTGDVYARNPFSTHLPEPTEERLPDGSIRRSDNTGIPGYDPTALVRYPSRVQSLPLNRLESTQRYVSRTHVNNMGRRKGSAPPIEVTHHTGVDRYVITEGNHRAVLALKRHQADIPALVTRIEPWERKQ